MNAQAFINTLLSDTDASLRRRAAEELIGINTVSTDAINAFAKGLSDGDKGVRDICALGILRSPEVNIAEKARAVAPLIINDDIEIRNLAGDVLLKLGAPAVDALYPFLTDPKEDHRKFACDIIGLSNNPEAIPHVRRLLMDTDDNVRCAAIEALGFLKASDLLGDVIAMYDDEVVQPYVIGAVGHIGGKHGQEFLLTVMKDDDAFVQIAAIDALALCADEIGIAHKLLTILPTANPDVQPVLLRTIYSIAFRLQAAIALPRDLRSVAYQALTDDDRDTRIAGLLALGSEYEEEDVSALLEEVKSNNPDTHQHILSVALHHSSPAMVREFFERVFDTLEECNAQITEFLGYLTALLPHAQSENAAITIQAVMREYSNVVQYQRREIIEFLLAVNREAAVHLLSDEIASGEAQRMEDATNFASYYKIRELVFSEQAQNV
jgi:HEAT repeat protein